MVDKCIIWEGAKWAQGRYGMDVLNGKSMGAHRAEWIRQKGPIPIGLVVCHKCDNGLCINIKHLFLGTLSDNMKDCVLKGRHKLNGANQKGSNNHNARKDYEFLKIKVKEMRMDGYTYAQIREALSIKSNGHLRALLLKP